jgi:hypothetical protein
MNGRVRSTAEWGGALIGATLAVALLAGWSVPGGTRPAPASVTLAADRSDDLDFGAAAVSIGHARLAPGSPALERAFTARNATASALVVRIRAVPQDVSLDDALALRVSTGHATIFSGPLRDLRSRGSDTFALASHETARIDVRAWLPASARGYQARVETVPLRFLTAKVTR